MDEEVVVQGLRFVWRVAEIPDVRPHVVDLLHEHATGDPAPDGGRLVLCEVDAGRRVQGAEDGADVGAVFVLV
jgi:hypothetical protein